MVSTCSNRGQKNCISAGYVWFPQGSILAPILFNLYVTIMSTFTSSTCLQFVDDTTLFKRCKIKDIPDFANIIQNDVESLKVWCE